MEKMKNKGLIEREQKMSYKNFNVAVYCPVGNVNEIQDLEEPNLPLREWKPSRCSALR